MEKGTETRARRRGAAGKSRSMPRRRRRWLRRLAIGFIGLMVVTVALCGWAWASVDRSTIARALWWRDADVGDQYRFPARRIPSGDVVSPLPSGQPFVPAARDGEPFDAFLTRTGTLAFLVVHRDRLVYERYLNGAARGSLLTSLSVAKSVVSTLVGIAIQEGSIESVVDPVTDYLPELATRDRRFTRITIRHLLTMSSGIRYWEAALPWPWSDDTFTYYGVDLRRIALDRTRIQEPPGRTWHYNNYHLLLLGLVLERATGMSVSEYMATRVWQPLGAAADATWSLDSTRSGFEKMESGLNATATDYARFGLLYLHGGTWNGHRIVSEDWVASATARDVSTDPAAFYQYFWWVD